MKQYTYNNLTTGRKNEVVHANNEQEVIETMAEVGYKVEIIDVFDVDKFLETNPEQQTTPPDHINTVKPETVDIKTILFETNGVKFKVVGEVVYKKDWIEIKDKEDYKVVRALKGKNDSIRETIITNDVKIFKNDWVEVEKNDE